MRAPIRWCLALAVVVLSAAPAARGQESEIAVNVEPRKVPANGQVRVDIVVSGPNAGNAVLAGQPQGKKLIPSGSVSTSSSFQLVNGVMSASKTFSLSYLPSGTGQGEVPSFTIRVDGTERKTAPVAVTITEAAQSPPPPTGRGSDEDDRIQVEVVPEIDRSRIYQGESVVLQYRLLFRTRVTGLLSPQHLDPVPSFVVEDLPMERVVRTTTRDGVPWQEVVLFERRLTPTRSGKLTIGPVPFGFEVVDPRLPTSFFTLRSTATIQRTARALTVEVLPLPTAGRPADFSGAVGRFSLSAALDRTDLAAGDAAALTVTVQGDGPLESVTPPAIPGVADLRVFDPEVGGGRRDRRSWTYPIVPQTAGVITIPPLRWSYFDPKAAAYRTLESAPLTMTVAAGQASQVKPGGAAARQIRQLATDLHFIKPAPEVLADRRLDLYRRPWYWMLVGLPWAAIPGVLIAGWRRERLDRSGRTRRRRAAPRARKRLKRARASLGGGDVARAQQTAAEALAGYVADRARRSAQGMTYDAFVNLALEGGASEESARSLREVAEGLDGLRYTPAGSSAEETSRLIERAGEAIQRLEKEWR